MVTTEPGLPRWNPVLGASSSGSTQMFAGPSLPVTWRSMLEVMRQMGRWLSGDADGPHHDVRLSSLFT